MPIDQAAGAAPARPAFLAVLMSCHPAPALLVTVVVTALAAACGRGAGGCALVMAATATGQLSIGWCNDRVDAARDRAAGRRDKPLAARAVPPVAVAVAAGAALAACVPLSLACGAAAGAAHLTGVAAGWAYDLGVKRTAWSWLPYAVAFGLLPAFVTLGLPGTPWPPAWATATGALLGVGAHAANVLPDIDADLAAGVRGLPQRLGARRARWLTAGALAAASGVLLLGPPGRPGPGTWGALGVTAALSAVAAASPAGGGRRTAFLAVLGVAGADVALLVLRGSRLA